MTGSASPPPIRYRTRTLKSEGRLERLIEERLRPDADKDAIDRRIWDLFGERWAIMGELLWACLVARFCTASWAGDGCVRCGI